MKMLVTGGCGFIGSNFIEKYINNSDVELLINVDCLTYAGKLANTKNFIDNEKYLLFQYDICDSKIEDLFKHYSIDTVINFAAETHVDNSIHDPSSFIRTNINGIYNLLRISKMFWKNTNKKIFVNVSTDEVFGSLSTKASEFTLDTPYKPNSPYSATKAAGDHLCRSFFKTYDLPVIVTNCCNNYGPRQHFEKLIPLTINRLKKRHNIPVYGTGFNIREWIYVEDHCDALWEVTKYGEEGEQYLIGSGFEITNKELVELICDLYDEVAGEKNSRDLISFVSDRPGHDFRYALDSSKIQTDLHWIAKTDFNDGLKKTIKYYIS